MKNILKLGLILFAAIGLSGCDLNDDDSLGNFWVDLGFVQSGENGDGFMIKVDEGYFIIPVNMNGIDTDKYPNNERVIVNYTIIGDVGTEGDNKQYYARINSLKDVLFKGIIDITPEIEDSIGNDPIHVENVWKTDSLLNFQLYYYGFNKIHYINLVKQPGELTEDDLPVELELRHNDNDDNQTYQMAALVTFDMRSIQIAGRDSVNFVVKGKKYDGNEFTYKGVYKY